jgi:hypothetical protein
MLFGNYIGVASDLLPAPILLHPYRCKAEVFSLPGVRHSTAPQDNLRCQQRLQCRHRSECTRRKLRVQQNTCKQQNEENEHVDRAHWFHAKSMEIISVLLRCGQLHTPYGIRHGDLLKLRDHCLRLRDSIFHSGQR